MITLRRSGERRRAVHGGQETWLTFDGENPSDPMRRGFRTLEALNEEGLAPGAGFTFRPSNDVELLTYVWKGALIQEDQPGGNRLVEIGEWCHSSSQAGATRGYVNGSRTDEARVFQCGFTPDRAGLKGQADKKRFLLAERRGVLRLILSPDGRDASLRIRQDARVYSSVLDPGHHVVHEMSSGRGAWLQVIHGRIQLIDQVLGAGDGASHVDEPAVSLTALEPSEILLFDLA